MAEHPVSRLNELSQKLSAPALVFEERTLQSSRPAAPTYECTVSLDLPGDDLACRRHTATAIAVNKKAAKVEAATALLAQPAIQLLLVQVDAGHGSADASSAIAGPDKVSTLNLAAQRLGLSHPSYVYEALGGEGTHNPLWQATVKMEVEPGRAFSATGSNHSKAAAKKAAAEALLAKDDVAAALLGHSAAAAAPAGASAETHTADADRETLRQMAVDESRNYVGLLQELQQFCTSSGILRFTPANYEPQPPSAPTLPGSPPLHTVQLTFSCCEDDGDTVPVVTRASAHSVKAARQAAAKQALLHPAVLERLRQWWYETRYMAPKAEGEADTKMQLLAVLVDHAERAQRVKQQQLAPEGEYPLSQRMLQC